MGTKVLEDICNDVKLLISSLTNLKEVDDGFSSYERTAMSQIKHHTYLSVDSRDIKKLISETIEKFEIHGKHSLAEKLRDLVNSLSTNFDFEKHPQYDLKWSLLSFLLSLSSKTPDWGTFRNSNSSANVTISHQESELEEIDWGEYLKDTRQEFFQDFQSDSEESEWSDIECEETSRNLNDAANDSNVCKVFTLAENEETDDQKISKFLAQGSKSRFWLEKTVQNSWWNELDWVQCPVTSRFPDVKFLEFWRKDFVRSTNIIGTLSEYQVCRELLWMLHSPSQMVLFKQENDSKFSIRDNVSIPSLTVTGFKGILNDFCEYFSMLREFEEFGQNLCSNIDNEKRPSLTYEMYNSTLQQILLEMRSGLVDIEKNVTQQDKTHTLLSLSQDLRKFFQRIRILYEVHKSAIEDWRLVANWKCVHKLLSMLYLHVESSCDKDRRKICTRLYLSSLAVYMNIIDVWLGEGRLEDYRDEFIASKSLEQSSENRNLQFQQFSIRNANESKMTDPLSEILFQEIGKMGRNIELLVALERVSDMWKITDNDSELRKSLNEEFQEKLLNEVSKYYPQSVEDATDAAPEEIIIPCDNDSDFEQNLSQQLSIIENPFLKKAFEAFLPLTSTNKKDAVDGEQNSTGGTVNIEDITCLEKVSEPVLPIKPIIENTLTEILNIRYSKSSQLVKDILTREYKLEGQLKLMRSVYLMEASHVMNGFCFQLFHEIENNRAWYNSSFLTCILEEALSQKWPETSSKWSVRNVYLGSCTVLQAVDNISLHYSADWPINMLLNESTLDKYNSIFRLHLKLKWALWTLSNLRFSDLVGSKAAIIKDSVENFYVKRLENMRFWLLHTLGSIHSYLCGQVLQSLGYILENALAIADDLDTVVTIHHEYMEKIYEHCFQKTKFSNFRRIINDLLEMCLHTRDKWLRGHKTLPARVFTDLDGLEKNFVQHHKRLVSALRSAIHENNADYLTSLESALSSSSPCV